MSLPNPNTQRTSLHPPYFYYEFRGTKICEAFVNPFTVSPDTESSAASSPTEAVPIQEPAGKTTANESMSNGIKPLHACPLLALPQELKDQIFNTLVTSGHLEIMRTSKAINACAKPAFINAAVLRFCFNRVEWEEGHTDCVRLGMLPHNINQIPAFTIRNIKVLIDFKLFASRSEECAGVMSDIVSYAQNTQQISLDVDILNYLDTDSGTLINPYFEWIKAAKSFKRVYVTAVSGEETGSGQFGNYHPRVARARNRQIYKRVCWALRSSLGPEKYYKGTEPEDDYIEFRPRAHWESQAISAGTTDTSSGGHGESEEKDRSG